MSYRPTILNIAALTFMVGILMYTIWNYNTLSEGEGWGVVAMMGLVGIALFALLIDYVLRKIIKNRFVLNVLGLLVAAGLTVAICIDF